MTSDSRARDAWGRSPGELGCKHCEPDWKYVGRGWIEQINNGPIVACPVCNPDEKHERPNDV
jgi:hypothetical protein